MDETTATTASAATSTATSPSSAHPDSAIFEDIDNLSPITAVKASHAITSFPGFSSPILFASPDLNTSEGSYSKRFQCHPSKDISDSREKKIECCSEATAKIKIQSSSSLVHFTDKECDNGSKEDPFSCSSGSFDKYVVDAMEVDHEKTKHSSSYDLKQLNQCPDSKTKSASNRSAGEDGEEAMVTFPGVLQLEEQDSQENSSFNEKPVEKDANNEGNELYSSPKDQRSEHKNISDGVSEFPAQPINSIIGYKDGSNATGEASLEKYDNEGQGVRGLQRRRLLFEEADRLVVGNTLSLWNPSKTETRRSSASLVDSEVREPNVSQGTKTYSNTEDSNQTLSTISFKRCSNSKSTLSKPSGIGLHLNSIISSKPKCASIRKSISSDDKGCLDVKGEKFVSCSGYPHESVNNGSISLKTGGIFSTNSQNEEASDSHCPEYEPSNDSALLMQRDYQTTSCGKRKFTLEQACGFEEWSQSSSKKKSRKAGNNDSDGCKRCNCKKTKCLKLYCDCFAAGVYCSEFCSCQGCFNRPDYIDTVLEVKQLIESRNPLAFAPKVVEHLIGSHVESNMKAVTDTTPPSSRHKRGCNCKKSMCMKKYCECYQNNVGCSSGCRCEGCQNVYGMKEDFLLAKDAYAVPISEICDENVEIGAYRDCFLQNELNNHHSVTPVTPSFQLSNHGKEGSTSKFSIARFVSSPEPDHNLMPNRQGSLGTTENYSVLVKSREKGIASSHPELDCDDSDTIDVFSPAYSVLAEVDNSSRLLESHEQLPFKSGYFSSVTSLDRCESLFTTPVGQIGHAKLFETNSENLDNILEDGMPEILKNPTNAIKISSPNKKRVSPPRISTVKGSSPNKKRVSPPRICGLRKLSSFSSASLKSGRKFILRGLPSFPSITPCIDGNDSSNQSKKS